MPASDLAALGPMGSRPAQDEPLWHVGYFELKVISAQQTQEEFFSFPLSAYNQYRHNKFYFLKK